MMKSNRTVILIIVFGTLMQFVSNAQFIAIRHIGECDKPMPDLRLVLNEKKAFSDCKIESKSILFSEDILDFYSGYIVKEVKVHEPLYQELVKEIFTIKGKETGLMEFGKYEIMVYDIEHCDYFVLNDKAESTLFFRKLLSWRNAKAIEPSLLRILRRLGG